MPRYQHISHGFDPVFDTRSRVLVLGSFPSVLSRANDFYYGNPANRFWRVIARWAGAPVPETIAEKRALLLAHGIALWDVVASCDVKGSSDASIRNVEPAAIERVLDAADIAAVLCNGGTAARLYGRYLQARCGGMPARALPSTSPANAAWSLERLCERWGAELAEAFEGVTGAGTGGAPGTGAALAHGGAAAIPAETDGRTGTTPLANGDASAAPAADAATSADAADADAPTTRAHAGTPAAPSPSAAQRFALPSPEIAAPRIEYAAVKIPAPPASSEAVRKSMQGNKRKDTKPELVVRQRLRAAGLSGYRLQWHVAGHPDIAWPGKKVAIMVQGCYWHRCPHCHPSVPKQHVAYWEAKFARNVERDRLVLRELEDAGWRVHVVWECQLKKKTIDATFADLLPQLAAELGKPLREESA